MTPKSITRLLTRKPGETVERVIKDSGEKRSERDGNLIKLSETSFPVSGDQPVNLRIMLHAASQMSSTRFRKVKKSCQIGV